MILLSYEEYCCGNFTQRYIDEYQKPTKTDFDAKLYKSNFQCLRYRPHGLIKITPANYCITLRKGNKAKLVLYESINVTIQKKNAATIFRRERDIL